MSGVCTECGCDDENACMTANGPCFWVDDDETICSGCAPIVEAPSIILSFGSGSKEAPDA